MTAATAVGTGIDTARIGELVGVVTPQEARPIDGTGPSSGYSGTSPSTVVFRSSNPTSPTWSASATSPGRWPAWQRCWPWAP
jgi:hypothetical protein